jgi:hypothetical protein
MTAPDVETTLRDALAAHTEGLRPDPDFVNATLDHSAASLRSTRRRQAAFAAGAVAAIVAMAAWQLPQLGDQADPGPTKAPDPANSAMAWARSLPRGADADLAYVDRYTLIAGSTRTVLVDGGEYTLLGTLPGGWFVDRRQTGGPYIDPDSYGYLNSDGHFTAYDPIEGAREVDGVAVSPDGSKVAYDGAVVDTGLTPTGRVRSRMGAKVASLPRAASTIVDWNNAVIVYRDAAQRLWEWSPGSAPQRAAFDGSVSGGLGYTREGRCVEIQRYDVDVATPRYRLCGAGDPISVSSGNYALMSDGEIVNLEQGVDFLTLPSGVDPAELQAVWESDDTLVLVTRQTRAWSTAAVLVRCVVSANLCERASDLLSSYPQLSGLPD